MLDAFALVFHPNASGLHFNTNLFLHTNASTFAIPLRVYNGQLKVRLSLTWRSTAGGSRRASEREVADAKTGTRRREMSLSYGAAKRISVWNLKVMKQVQRRSRRDCSEFLENSVRAFLFRIFVCLRIFVENREESEPGRSPYCGLELFRRRQRPPPG